MRSRFNHATDVTQGEARMPGDADSKAFQLAAVGQGFLDVRHDSPPKMSLGFLLLHPSAFMAGFMTARLMASSSLYPFFSSPYADNTSQAFSQPQHRRFPE
jgi:hypothetical protein